jgi:putative ABC transport system ATP-binding protein
VSAIVDETVAGLDVVADGLVVSYGDHEVLHGVRLEVPGGRMLAITGPSGAGKTSLMWALAAMLHPDGGEVRVGGTAPDDRDHACAMGVVLMPQDNALATVLTAFENVLVPLLAAKVAPPEARARSSAALDAVGLGTAGDQLVEELSGGQQQRVAVARGLAQRGTVVLADEPTSELDAVNRGRVMALLRAEADRGAAVVVATHDPDAAAECDGELHLDEGHATWPRRMT